MSDSELKAMEDLAKFKEVELSVEPRLVPAAIVICHDAEFVAYDCCVGEGKNELQYPDEFSRNLNDLTIAECFDSVEDAVSFCRKNCPPGVQVLANPCTRAEEILHENSGVHENCLEGYRCPNCKEDTDLWASTRCWTLWSDDGTDGDSTSHYEIDETGQMECASCEFRGPVDKFKVGA